MFPTMMVLNTLQNDIGHGIDMNERIRLLVELAPYTTVSTEGRLFTQQDLAKFAELIVKECANQCTTEGPFVAEVVWGKQFHKKILEHFGVEE